MNIKEELRGCGVIVVTILAIVIAAVLILAIVGTAGDMMFDLLRQKK